MEMIRKQLFHELEFIHQLSHGLELEPLRISQIHLELRIEGFLIAVLSGRGFGASGYPDTYVCQRGDEYPRSILLAVV